MNENCSGGQVVRVAVKQRLMLRLFLLSTVFTLPAYIVPDEGVSAELALTTLALFLVALVMYFTFLVSVWQLTTALAFGWFRRVCIIAGMLIPLVSLLPLAYTSSSANAFLKKAGCPVGLLGVSRAELERIRTADQGVPAPVEA